ncbi:MAG: hypothetical protein L6N95_05370 [Candidatus Methylarchaceae archaeon HK01B]|nr:hypothetical protein [Candidatus Methylarchaceae archaeon HK01B]
MDLFKDRKRQLIEGIELIDGVKIRLVSKKDIEDIKSMSSSMYSIELSSKMLN